MSTVSQLGRLAARQQVQDYKANDPSMRILSQGPVMDKDFLYHASGKKFDLLDPSYNSKRSYGHEYGVPVVFAGDAPSSAFASNPTAEYQAVKDKIKNSVYHRLIDELTGRKALLGHTPGGYLYKLPASAFTQINREDNELGKWNKSTEYVSNRAVKPISVTAMQSTDVDAIPEYEYLGEDFVGEMPAQQYLKRAKNPKVIAAIKAWLNSKPTAITDAARAAKAKEVRKAIAAFSKQRNIDPNKALLLAGGSMYFRGLKDNINDIDFAHPGLKDFTKQTIGKYELDGGPGGMPADAYDSDKLYGLNVQKPKAILAFYKFLNRPKDQQKIQMLSDLVNSQNKQS